MTAPVILLHPEDNVVVCRRTVLAGERVIVEGAVDFVAAQDVDVGHKIARVALPSGAGGTRSAIQAGLSAVGRLLAEMDQRQVRVP